MSKQRESWDSYFCAIAKQVATRSTCDRANVGCVLVRDQHIVSTGYNGAPAGLPHCDEVAHAMENNHCVVGDTVVSKFQTGRYNTGHRTIRQIWENWQDPKKKGAMVRMKIRAVSPEGMIVPDSIIDVWRVGVKATVTLATRLGRQVTVTADHRVLTPEGWCAASDLLPGVSSVALNGKKLLDDVDWLRQKYEKEGLTQVALAALLKCNRKTIEQRLVRFGITRRLFQLGGWNRGLSREAVHNYQGRDVSPASARQRSRKYALADACVVCSASDELQVHHIDGDVWNDTESNLLTLCIGCHNVAHTPHAKVERIIFDQVVGVVPAGNQEVFDLTTQRHHNFVANGIIAHNCTQAVHAEQNAVIQAARNGVSTVGTTVYVTHATCWICCKILINAGVRRVVYVEPYRLDQRVLEAFAQAGVALVSLPKKIVAAAVMAEAVGPKDSGVATDTDAAAGVPSLWEAKDVAKRSTCAKLHFRDGFTWTCPKAQGHPEPCFEKCQEVDEHGRKCMYMRGHPGPHDSSNRCLLSVNGSRCVQAHGHAGSCTP